MGSLFRSAKVFRRMDLDKAEKAISAGRQAAREMGVNFSLAIMDIGANLVAFVRMDGCPVGCTDVAMKKARTAALFGFETGILGKMSQPGKPLYGVEHSNGGLITFPGGVPIKDFSLRSQPVYWLTPNEEVARIIKVIIGAGFQEIDSITQLTQPEVEVLVDVTRTAPYNPHSPQSISPCHDNTSPVWDEGN